MTTVAIDLATLVDAIADAVADRISSQLTTEQPSSPWMNSEQAAAYIASTSNPPRQRIYDLKQQGKITAHYDGGPPLFHRDDLDAYLRGGR